MLNADYAAAWVAWMNQQDDDGKSNWDKYFTRKQSTDRDDPNKKLDKFFLSADQKYIYKSPTKPILLTIGGKQFSTTQVEIPVVICRNIQTPEIALAKAATRGMSRALTQANNELDRVDPNNLTDQQRDAALDMVEKLKRMGILASDAGEEPNEAA